MARKFHLTLFDDVFARIMCGKEITLDDLADTIKGTTAARKEDLPLAKSARFGEERTKPDKDGKGGGSLRHDANVTAVSGAVGDYDAGVLSFDDARARLQVAGFSAVVHTTASHSPTHPRWRVWSPFSRELPVGEYARMVDRLNGVLGGVLARESWPLSQAFYVGRVTGVPFDIAVIAGEDHIDECAELDDKALGFQPAAAKTTGSNGAAPNFKDLDETELFKLIEAGSHYWRPVEEIAYRRAKDGGGSQDEVADEIREALDRVPQPQRDDKWEKAGKSLKKWITRAFKRATQDAKPQKGGGRPLSFPSRQPWPDEVDGAELLDEIAQVFRDHVVMPDTAICAVSLWTVHTYLFSTMLITPRLLLKSAEKRSGKSTTLMLVGALANRALSSAGISASAVFRTCEHSTPTLLIDEADTFLPENEELRGVINAGYIQGGQVIRVTGDNHEPRVFGCCCPVAIAAIKHLPDTIEDRAVAITLQRRLRSEPVVRLRQTHLALLAPLARKAQRWADDNRVALETADPFVPDVLNDRAADCWRILLAIAELAGETWTDRARTAAIKLALENADTETLLMQLLADLRALFETGQPPVFVTPDGPAMFSADIVAALHDMEDRPWPEFGRRRQPITPAQIARLLRDIKVRPGDIRHGVQKQKGYRRGDLADAFDRYLS